jgi:tetratricopeptide (TPR) repeat protein
LLLAFGCTSKNKNIPVSNFNQISEKVIDSLINESKIHYNRQTNVEDQSDHFLKEAIEIARNAQNKQATFNINMLIAKRLRNNAKYGKALEHLQKAQVLANEINNDELRAYAAHEMAVVFRHIDDNAQALKFHIQALEWAENAKDTFLIHCSLNGVGNVYFDYRDYAQAIEYFHRSLLFLGKKEPNLLGEAINCNLLGESWLFLGNPDSALIYLNRSYQVNVKIESELGQAICNNGKGLVYHAKKDYAKAIAYYHQALQLYTQTGDLFYQSMCLNNLGKSLMAIHSFKDAEQVLKNSLEIASTIGSKDFVLDASLELAQLYNETGKIKASYQYSQMALAYKDSITDDLKTQNMEAMDVLYKAEKQEREILILKQDAELNQLKMSRQKYLLLSIAGFLFIAILIVVFIFRQRRLKSKINEIGLEQKLLRAQLNPHFIFNSLSAVQNFIMKNDRTTASEYLVNFSRLMRNILIGSGEDFILLENELQILDDYLKLQQLRFQGKFNYYFELAETIDPKYCLVPPMLLQPFIENAIEHGVRDIQEQGIIITRFKVEKQKLIIEVDDNGRGLHEQKNSNKKKSHISMATKITRQRMQNLQAITKSPCTFEVIDKTKTTGLPGVLIRINIPFKEEGV